MDDAAEFEWNDVVVEEPWCSACMAFHALDDPYCIRTDEPEDDLTGMVW